MPNHFLDISGRSDRIIKKKVDAPAQGLSIIGGDIAQKVIISPMKNISAASGLSAKKGVAYFIHSVMASMTIDADDATQGCYIRTTMAGSIIDVMRVYTVPSTVATYNISHTLDILTDVGAAVQLGYLGANPTASGYVTINYQEVIVDEC